MMNEQGRHAFEARGKRGIGRTATQVWIAASEDQPIVGGGKGPRPRRPPLFIGVAAGFVLAVIIGSLYLRWSSSADNSGAVEVSSQEPAPAPATAGTEIAETDTSLLREQQVDGWVPYRGMMALEDFRVPDEQIGWMASEPDGIVTSGPAAMGPNNGIPIYDRPNGTVIGFHYTNLGFVPASAADDFDPHRARIERFGCDQTIDPSCVPFSSP